MEKERKEFPFLIYEDKREKGLLIKKDVSLLFMKTEHLNWALNQIIPQIR